MKAGGIGLAWVLGIVAATSAWGQDLSAPMGLSVSQVDYGPEGTMELSWAAGGIYERIELAVDSVTAPGDVDGAMETARVLALPGARTFGVRGLVGESASSWTTATFTVLRQSPIPEPVVSIECEFIPTEGGRLRVSWSLGADAWVSGVLEVPGWKERIVLAPGSTEAVITAHDEDPHFAWLSFQDANHYSSPPFTPLCLARIPAFRRGDCDGSRKINITDTIFSLNHLFRGGPRWFCDDACDSNDDGNVNITDVVYTLNYLFRSGDAPPLPGPTGCGIDLTPDILGGLCRCE
jgi:hypothetical protein